jgi:hypothetical protein
MVRAFIIGLCVIFLAPIVLLVIGGGLTTSIGGLVLGYHMSEAAKPETLPRKPEWNVVNVEPGTSMARSYATLVKRQELVQRRAVRISAYLSFEEVRANDPTPIEPGQRDAYIRTSAPRLARNECDAILAALASKCIVGESRISAMESRDIYRVDMVLTYVEKAEIGNVRTEQVLSFIENRVVLNRDSSLRTRVSRTGQAALRREFYHDAIGLCARQRKQHGNCSIQAIHVQASYDENNHMVTVSGSADIAILLGQETVQRLSGQSR